MVIPAYGELGAFGVAAQWQGGNESQWSRSKKLASFEPAFRNKVEALERRMTALGHPTRIHFAWRGLETQGRLTSGGTSWVDFSFHNAVDSSGAPAALGADLVHANVWWGDDWDPVARKNVPNPAKKAIADRYFADLGRESKRLGLYWGGDWRKPDMAHVQMYPNSSLAAIKARSMPLLQSVSGMQNQAAAVGDRINVVIRKPAFKLGVAGAATLALIAAAGLAYVASRSLR